MTAKTVVFITGAEGSGTTLLRRLLAAPPVCASLGRDFEKLPPGPEARQMFLALNQSNHRLWNTGATLSEHRSAEADSHSELKEITDSAAYERISHLVCKRSSPFGSPHGRRRPDLWDVQSLPCETRIVIIYRHPCAATYSAFRRGFDTDLRRLALSCEANLTRLAAQAAALGAKRVKTISYRRLCEAPGPALAPVADFCGLPFEPILAAARAEIMTRDGEGRYRQELEPAALDWLERYFDAERCAQWKTLMTDESDGIRPSS